MIDTYIPILRNRSNERQVLKRFGGLANFDQNSKDWLDLIPLVEVSGEKNLDNLRPFRDAGDDLFVDLPVYQTRRSTDLGNTVQSTLEGYGGQSNFFLQNSNRVTNPVISGRVETPVDYDMHYDLHTDLQYDFSSIMHRLMVRMRGRLSDDQKESLEKLSRVLRSSDWVVFDVVDNGFNEDLVRDLNFISDTFSANRRAVLNVFNAFEGDSMNRSPQVADELGIRGFGDFVINVRYPGGGGPVATKRIRHYHPNRAQVEEFDGNTYEEASNELTNWKQWKSEHCDYCREADGLSKGDPSTWKRIRMGHYITSVLRSET